MNHRGHDNRDDKKVWLSQADVAQLPDRPDAPKSTSLSHRCAIGLGLGSGAGKSIRANAMSAVLSL